MGMGRSQKYHRRTRYIYALTFDNGAVYIGQSIAPAKRLRQHQLPAGGWGGLPFKMTVLEALEGTQADAEEHEYAWRYRAGSAGWSIYGKPHILVSYRGRMNFSRRRLAASLKWPSELKAGGIAGLTARMRSWLAGLMLILPILVGLGLLLQR